MDENYFPDWHFFENGAMDLVRKGASRERGFKRMLQFIEIPAFSAMTGSELLKSNTDSRFVLATTTWDRHADNERFEKYRTYQPQVARIKLFATFQPTITHGSRSLDSVRTEALLAKLENLRLGLFPTETQAGLDGTFYELAFGELFTWVRFCWWEEAPAPWREMAELVSKFFDDERTM